jgi:hypothetical protein
MTKFLAHFRVGFFLCRFKRQSQANLSATIVGVNLE